MATRKQRRRREKEHRHEYETVYLDEEGNEVEVEPDELPHSRDQRRDRETRAGSKQPVRGGRTLQPPSWRRSAKRTLIIAPLFFAFLLIVEKKTATAFVVAVLYSVLFVPFSYGIDALVYRTQTKRLARRGG